MRKSRITEPLTDNAERARRETKRGSKPADRGRGGPSRAHAHAFDTSGGDHEKKIGAAPKKGGRPR